MAWRPGRREPGTPVSPTQGDVPTTDVQVTLAGVPERRIWQSRFSGFTVLILIIAVMMVLIIAPSVKLLVEQRQEINQLRSAIAADDAAASELERDVNRWNDPAYVKAQARDRLYYVMPGETSYLVIDDATVFEPSQTQPISTDVQITQSDWASTMLESVVVAGLADVDPDEG